MNNLLFKLSLESTAFNVLMYIVILIGALAVTTLNLLANIFQIPTIHTYVGAVATGTMCAGALCHYFLHRAASYRHDKMDQEVIYYQKCLDGHAHNQIVVGFLNFMVLLVITGFVVQSAYVGVSLSNILPVFTGAGYFIGLIFFCLAPAAAKNGWNGPRDMSD